MSTKLVGSLLIFASGVLLTLLVRKQQREEYMYLQDMASALEQMETAIRFYRQPLPDLIQNAAQRAHCGYTFSLLSQLLKREETLQNAWQDATRKIPWESARDVLSGLELAGDMQRVSTNLQAAAGTLREIMRQRQSRKQEQQKITMALAFSGCGLLVIILL